ncbi:tetratricopeptide repeat protein [Kineosporia succinea]|uniref:Tetratricopeptide (TPR) repeat protein n=1 Tax=Kineosporia succinea TaxID=84632 RepID=A0ABT9P728_9ACTN|nr:hypothetical protein [Kineosporia succinea]MDP9828499.1 tetratricopeptide (TPR) repeat protein [Kineosporia succinea]
MSAARKRLDELLTRIDAAGPGPAGRLLIDEAVTLADAEGLDELGYAARLRLLAAANRDGDTDAQLSAFAWCVGRNQSDPQRFPQRVGEHDLLWFHKHVVGALMGSPLFTLDDVDAALDAMADAYNRAGVGLSGVWQARFQAVFAMGRPDRAAGMLAAAKRLPRDRYSHCAACSRAQEAEHLYATGDDEGGLRLADEVLELDLTCGAEPANTLAHALLPLLRAGRPADARRAHLRGYRAARGNPDNLRMIAQHLRFCAVTGNEARGLEILEQHVRWLSHDGLNARGHLDVLSAAVVLLRAAGRAGAGEQVVTTASAISLEPFFGRRETPWTVNDLMHVAYERAAAIAAAFDARNGNAFHTGLLEADIALLETCHDVPLATRPTLPAAVPIAMEDEGDLRARAALLKAETERRLASDEPGLALTSAQEALNAGLALGDRELSVAAARLASLAATTVGQDDAAVEYCRTAVREAAAGELAGEAAFRLELGAALCRAGEPDEGTLEIEEAIARLRAAGAPAGELAEAHYLLGQALAAQFDGDGARDSYRNAVALASNTGDWAATTRYGMALGTLLFDRRDRDSLNVLAGAVESSRRASDSLSLVKAEHLLGQALAQIAGVEPAEAVLREALREASNPLAGLNPAVVFEHADILDSLARTIGEKEDRLDEAVSTARESADAFRSIHAEPEAGRALVLAASLLTGAGRSGEALPLLRQAEPLLRERPNLLLECLTGLAAAYERLGRTADARATAARVERVRQDQYGDLAFIDDLG